jgi:hypothetical protein
LYCQEHSPEEFAPQLAEKSSPGGTVIPGWHWVAAADEQFPVHTPVV